MSLDLHPLLVLFDNGRSHFHYLRDRCRVHLLLLLIFDYLWQAALTYSLFRRARKDKEGNHEEQDYPTYRYQVTIGNSPYTPDR